MLTQSFLGHLAGASVTFSASLEREKRAILGTATIDLAVPLGTSAHLASGLLYGIPDQPDQIPDHFYTDIGFNYGRAGGSQLSSPARGWVYGTTEFEVSKLPVYM